jgi:hypothetical protein
MNEGTIAYNPDAQDSIRHSKGKTQRTTKNQKPTPTPKKKTANSCHGVSQTKLARRTQFLPRRTKTKGGKKKNAVHEMKKNKKRKQRSSRGARRGAPEVLGPFGGFKALC